MKTKPVVAQVNGHLVISNITSAAAVPLGIVCVGSQGGGRILIYDNIQIQIYKLEN